MTKAKVKKPATKLLDLVKKGIEEKKGEEIVTLDIYKTNPSVCDYFVICHGNSNTQVAAIAEEVKKVVNDEMQEKPVHIEGMHNAEWVILDYVNVVVHVFQKPLRLFYDLEHLWADAS